MFCQKPLIFLKMYHSLHKYVLIIWIFFPSILLEIHLSVMKSSLHLLAVVDYYVFIPLNKALKPSFYVLDIEIAR